MLKIRRKFSSWLVALGVDDASDELVREQFCVLSLQVPVLYAIVAFNSLFMAVAVIDVVPLELALICPAALVPIMVARIWVWKQRSKHADIVTAIPKIRRALLGNIAAANVLAGLLGLWSINVLWALPPERYAFIPLFTILSMITCAYCLVSLPAAAYSIVISGATMICIAMAMTGDAMLMGMAANIAIVSVFVMYMVSKQYQQLRRIVKSRSKIIEQRAYANELAHHDQLTGLPNRRALVERLIELQKNRPELPIAMAMVDMNGFKPVNDTYGHAAGDTLLITVGQRLKKMLGKDGLVARLGGDEFAILFEEPQDVDWVLRRAQQALVSIARPLMLGEHELRVSAGIGVAAKSKMPSDPLELLQHSDIALYEAKANNRSAISIYEGGMEARVKRRISVEKALSDRNQMATITLHYQPIIGLRPERLAAFEALARWDHPELGPVAPSEFVEAAERNGLATRLTIHLFRQAVETAKTWDDDTHLSFNLSGSGLGTSNLDKLLPEILSEFEFDPHRLAVEVTETALLSDPAAARKVLASLQKKGVRIVLDDFGAGYASIGYLREMAFDGIKLDGSLIQDIDSNSRSRDLLSGVLQLCQAIGADVTAEMVEREEQFEILRTLPVKNVQGYLLGGPVTADKTLEPEADKAEKRKGLLGVFF